MDSQAPRLWMLPAARTAGVLAGTGARRLPRLLLEASALGEEPTPSRGTPVAFDAIAVASPPRSKTILVVDDDHDVRESVADALRDAGYDVRQAASGTEALEALESMGSEPCLVPLDMMMPEMSGAELLAILDKSKNLGAIPVVVCSGTADEAPGARRLLRKPVALDLLLRVVEEFCDGV